VPRETALVERTIDLDPDFVAICQRENVKVAKLLRGIAREFMSQGEAPIAQVCADCSRETRGRRAKGNREPALVEKTVSLERRFLGLCWDRQVPAARLLRKLADAYLRNRERDAA
jgi:hypothetical protein